jgi:hypothetical protein
MLDGSVTWKRLMARRPWHAAAEPERDGEGAVPSLADQRQRHLARLRTHGIPLWSEEPEHCDACGRALLAGEQPLLLRRGDALLLACPLCAERLYEEGCLRVSAEAPRDAEANQLPLAV